MSNLSSQQLLELLQNGKSEAATELVDKYATRLIALASSRISSKLNARLDAEDLVQSAYRSFFTHAQDGRYHLQAAGDLWRLLASITLNKLYGQIEKHSAAKRSINREETTSIASKQLQLPEPSPAEVVCLLESLHLALRCLSPDEQRVLTATLQGDAATDVADLIQKSERTVRRLLASAREKVEQHLVSTDDHTEKRSTVESHLDNPLKYTDYVLLNLLSAGGMGKVYRARSKREGDKLVAIKTLHKARLADERAVAQFTSEAKVLSELDHSNIVRVDGLGQFPGGGYFMVMEFVEGLDLQRCLNSQVFSIEDALSILSNVCDAVGYAHNRGIIHGDLKPGNILRRNDGQILITDFGFAYLTATRFSSPRQFVGGTAGYLAPEVLHGTRPPSPASDIYSLGILLSALITGKPLDRPEAGVWPSGDLAAIAPIIDRCLSSDPDRRYPSASELNQEIESYLDKLGRKSNST